VDIAGRRGAAARTRKLHVFDPDTGAHLRAIEPPVPGPMASPMTYLHQGRQYVVAASVAGLSAALVAYALATPQAPVRGAGSAG